MNNGYVIAMVAVSAAVTALLRFAPFLIFRNGHKTPALVTYLGKVLHCAISSRFFPRLILITVARHSNAAASFPAQNESDNLNTCLSGSFLVPL